MKRSAWADIFNYKLSLYLRKSGEIGEEAGLAIELGGLLEGRLNTPETVRDAIGKVKCFSEAARFLSLMELAALNVNPDAVFTFAGVYEKAKKESGITAKEYAEAKLVVTAWLIDIRNRLDKSELTVECLFP